MQLRFDWCTRTETEVGGLENGNLLLAPLNSENAVKFYNREKENERKKLGFGDEENEQEAD